MHVSLSVSETMSYGETDILSTSEHSLLKVYATGLLYGGQKKILIQGSCWLYTVWNMMFKFTSSKKK